MKPTVFYHARCNDGKHAAFLWWKRYGHMYDYVPVNYSAEHTVMLREWEGYRVFVDFCPTDSFRENDVIIDHHPWIIENEDVVREQVRVLVCDKNECGASLVARHLAVNDPFLPFVRDRDLWIKKLDGSDAVSKYLGLHHETRFEDYKNLTFSDAMLKGKAILEYEEACKRNIDVLEVTLRDFGPAKLVNCTQAAILSDLGEYLGGLVIMYKPIEWGPFTGEPVRWLYSCRDQREDAKARNVAQRLGGGGHQKAAGANSDIWIGDLIESVGETKKGVDYE